MILIVIAVKSIVLFILIDSALVWISNLVIWASPTFKEASQDEFRAVLNRQTRLIGLSGTALGAAWWAA